MKKTWWRMRVTIPMTDKEIEVLRSGNSNEIRSLLLRKWENGECKPDGDTYMPEECAEEVGLEYEEIGTNL